MKWLVCLHDNMKTEGNKNSMKNESVVANGEG